MCVCKHLDMGAGLHYYDYTFIKTNNIIHYYWFFCLSLMGPSSLTFNPLGAHDWSLFLQSSSTDSSSVSVPSTPMDWRMVKVRRVLTTSESLSLVSPSIWSLWMLMQWVAMLQVVFPFLTCDLWLDHLAFGSAVFPTYWRPQGQRTTYTTLTALQETGAGMEKLLPGKWGEEMREQNVASLHILQEHPGDL